MKAKLRILKQGRTPFKQGEVVYAEADYDGDLVTPWGSENYVIWTARHFKGSFERWDKEISEGGMFGAFGVIIAGTVE
jgi:hypothetical protein